MISQRAERRRRKLSPIEYLDEQEQEETIARFQNRAVAQKKIYRLCFSIVTVLPSPLFIFKRHYREHPKLALLALVSLVSIAYSMRVSRTRAPLLRKLNLIFGLLITIAAYLTISKSNGTITIADSLWAFPLTLSITAYIIERWFDEVDTEISKLMKYRYDLRGA